MAVFVVLLRAIGPFTHRVMSMAQWREGVAAAGFSNPETYIATGNMIVEGTGPTAEVTRRMNEVVLSLGLTTANVAVVRTPAQLRRLVKANPFPEAAIERASQMAVYFFVRSRPDLDWVKDYDGPEPVRVESNHLVVDYPHLTLAGSKLPGLIEKRSGPATARNWNTLTALAAKATARERKATR